MKPEFVTFLPSSMLQMLNYIHSLTQRYTGLFLLLCLVLTFYRAIRHYNPSEEYFPVSNLPVVSFKSEDEFKVRLSE